MSLSPETVDALLARGLPILLLDTCAVLDVVRDITRDSMKASDVEAGIRLLEHAEAAPPRLIVMAADQVANELAENLPGVEQEARDRLARLQSSVSQVHEIAELFGAGVAPDTTVWDDHVARARAVVDRWTAVSTRAPETAQTQGRVFARVMAPRIPARKGKDSTKDCLIVETYLEAAAELRAAAACDRNRLSFIQHQGILRSRHASGGTRDRAGLRAGRHSV